MSMDRFIDLIGNVGFSSRLFSHSWFGILGWGFFASVGLVFYILKGIGLMEMAKDKGVENPWLAFIPIADAYILGQIIGKFDSNVAFKHDSIGGIDLGFRLKLGNPALGLLLANVALLLSDKVPFIGNFIWAIALFVLAVGGYELYKMIDAQKAIIYTVLSILFFPVAGILLFMNRQVFRNDPKIEI